MPNKDCVVIDTNIWRASLLLQSPVGEALVYTLGRQTGLIGLPEVVEVELTAQIAEHAAEAAESLIKSSRVISTLCGSPFTPDVPDDAGIRELVESRLSKLSPILIRVPFSLEHAKAALAMVQAKLPPNGEKNQQFKDSAIWQAVLSLLPSYRVHLVTNDRAFLLDRKDPSKGLAKSLVDDCGPLASRISVYCDLRSCLAQIRSDAPSFDRDNLESLILAASMPTLHNEANRLDFELGNPINMEIFAFRTDNADRLAIDFSITFDFQPGTSSSDRRINCRATAHGSCYLESQANSLSDHFVEYVGFSWDYVSGGQGKQVRTFKGSDSVLFPRRIGWEWESESLDDSN